MEEIWKFLCAWPIPLAANCFALNVDAFIGTVRGRCIVLNNCIDPPAVVIGLAARNVCWPNPLTPTSWAEEAKKIWKLNRWVKREKRSVKLPSGSDSIDPAAPDWAFAFVKTTVWVVEPRTLLDDEGTTCTALLCVELVTGTEIKRLVGCELALAASAAPAAPDNDNENGWPGICTWTGNGEKQNF